MRVFAAPRLCAGLFALACSVLAATPSYAQTATEYAAKAAFIYNIALFSSLPRASDTMRLCVLGRNPFGSTLDSLEGKPVGQAKMTVAYPGTGNEALKQCQILFIGASEEHNLDTVAEAARDAGILTISDLKGAARRGAMLELALENKRIAFEGNGTAMRAASIVLSSKVLRLAKAVY